MALTHDHLKLHRSPPRTIRHDELQTVVVPVATEPAIAPPSVTLDNWEEIYWKRIKLALYAPLREFPEALAAVNAQLFALRDEIYALHGFT